MDKLIKQKLIRRQIIKSRINEYMKEYSQLETDILKLLEQRKNQKEKDFEREEER